MKMSEQKHRVETNLLRIKTKHINFFGPQKNIDFRDLGLFLLSLIDGLSLCSCIPSLCNCNPSLCQLLVSDNKQINETHFLGAVFVVFFCFQSGALTLAICCVLELKHAICWVVELKSLMRVAPHCFYGFHWFCHGVHFFWCFWLNFTRSSFIFPQCSWNFWLVLLIFRCCWLIFTCFIDYLELLAT